MKNLEGRSALPDDISLIWRDVPSVDRNYSKGDHPLNNIFNDVSTVKRLKVNNQFEYVRNLINVVSSGFATCGKLRKALSDREIVVPIDGNDEYINDNKIVRKLFGFSN